MLSVSGQCCRLSAGGQPCLHHLHVFSTAFPGGHSLRLASGSFLHPHPSSALLESFRFEDEDEYEIFSISSART